jgi:hypothetical protein
LQQDGIGKPGGGPGDYATQETGALNLLTGDRGSGRCLP